MFCGVKLRSMAAHRAEIAVVMWEAGSARSFFRLPKTEIKSILNPTWHWKEQSVLRDPSRSPDLPAISLLDRGVLESALGYHKGTG